MVDVEKTFNVCQMSGNYSKNKSEIKIHLTKKRVIFFWVYMYVLIFLTYVRKKLIISLSDQPIALIRNVESKPFKIKFPGPFHR